MQKRKQVYINKNKGVRVCTDYWRVEMCTQREAQTSVEGPT